MTTTYADYLLSLLTADSLLASILTGGMYLFEEAGRDGISRIEVPQAFIEKNGILKPMALIYQAQAVPTGEAVDSSSGYQSTVTPIYSWIYDDGDAGYGNIESAAARMKILTNFQRIPNGFQFIWGAIVQNKRERLLNNAAFWQPTIKAYGYSTS